MNMRLLKQRDADAQRGDIVSGTCQEAGTAACPLGFHTTSSESGGIQTPCQTSRVPCHSSRSFTTRKGQKFCGNPKLLWVQRYMKNLDAKQKKASSRTRVMDAKVAVQRHPANSTFI